MADAADPDQRGAAALGRSPDVTWRRTLDGMVLLPPEGAMPLRIVGPATAMWDLLAEPLSRDALIAAVVGMYDPITDELRHDVTAMIDTLVGAGVIRLVPQAI